MIILEKPIVKCETRFLVEVRFIFNWHTSNQNCLIDKPTVFIMYCLMNAQSAFDRLEDWL